MKFLYVLCIVLAVSCSSLAAPGEEQALIVRSRRDLSERSMQRIQDLIARLQKAGEEAMEAVGKFSSDLMTEAQNMRDRILKDIDSFRNRISTAIQNVYDRFTNSSSSVRECVDARRSEAAAIFDQTTTRTLSCLDTKITDIGSQIQSLRELANTAITEAAAAVESMRKCTETNNNLLGTGSCIMVLMTQVELKSVRLIAQGSFSILTTNLAIAGLPMTLETCAGTELIQAGIQSGKIAMDIGSCSASAIFTTLSGTP